MHSDSEQVGKDRSNSCRWSAVSVCLHRGMFGVCREKPSPRSSARFIFMMFPHAYTMSCGVCSTGLRSYIICYLRCRVCCMRFHTAYTGVHEFHNYCTTSSSWPALDDAFFESRLQRSCSLCTLQTSISFFSRRSARTLVIAGKS